MRRPITITHPVVLNDGKPFEAYGAREVPSNALGFCFAVSPHQITFNKAESIEELEATRASITFQLAQALNPPIKVTQAVLEEMEKVPEAKFRVQNSGHYTECSYDSHWGQKLVDRKYIPRGAWVYEKVNYDEGGVDIFNAELQIGDYIQADCPLALQVLLQFNTEGETHA